MKKRIITFFIILAVIIFSIAPPIRAENEQTNSVMQNTIVGIDTLGNTVEDLQTQYEEVEKQINEKEERLQYIESVLPEVMVQLQELNLEIAEYEKEIESLGKEAENLEASITELEAKLDVAEKNYEKQREIFETRLIVMYEAGETTYLDVLLNSSSLSEFLSVYYIMAEIAAMDAELMQEMELEKLGIQTAKETLEKQKKQFKTAKDNKEKSAIALENMKTVRNSYMNQLTEEQLALQQEIDAYYQAINNIEAEIVMLTTANVGTDYVGGSMAWPVPGYSRITSPFGMRTHPITGVYKLHTGTDVSAPIGANFIAANSGIVIKASRDFAYGNMVIIDHGGGVSTLYAHGSEILVETRTNSTKRRPSFKSRKHRIFNRTTCSF